MIVGAGKSFQEIIGKNIRVYSNLIKNNLGRYRRL